MTESLEYRLAEMERRFENLLRLGTVEELDDDAARVRVRSGKILTTWLPFFTRRAGEDRDWWAPEPGEQVMVLSPSGDLAQGRVLPSLYRDDYPAPATDRNKRRIEFAGGAFLEHDRESGKLHLSITGDALIEVGGKADITAEGKATLIGKGTVDIVGADGAAVKGSVQGDCVCSYTGKPHAHISATVKESP